MSSNILSSFNFNGVTGYKSIIVIKSHISQNPAVLSYTQVRLNVFLKVWEVVTRSFSEK